MPSLRLTVAIIEPPPSPDGTLQLETLPTLFDEKTRLLAITHVSNVLGTENPLAEMITLAHQHGAKVLVDGAYVHLKPKHSCAGQCKH
ncbi:aminotransferase class V-fold PLP-dependent enzyme [Escherichia coli]|uniref:aminotransferase class V-fold PLP-dependent enzyme n=1 Tax=Escherichia coli TaxID=562 RepID=UPI003EE255D7